MATLQKLKRPRERERHPAKHPHCIFCDTPMRLARIEPSVDEGYDCRSFECPTCSNAVTGKVKRT